MKQIKDPSRKGDIAELEAVVWLLKQGYEVFRNVGSTGPVDIIATRDGEILKIDVKTVTWNGEGWAFGSRGRKKEYYKNSGITLLYYNKGSFAFKLLGLPEPDANKT